MRSDSETATLLLSCRDQKGLVAAVSDFIYRQDGNVVHADQHTDPGEGLFLQRVEWELAGFRLSMDDFGREFQPLADRFGLNWELRTSQRKARVGILVSRQGHCLYDLLGRWRLGEFRAEFPIIISNHLDHESVARAFDIEFLHLPISPDTKSDQEAQMLEALTGRGIDLVILARYMQILSAEFL